MQFTFFPSVNPPHPQHQPPEKKVKYNKQKIPPDQSYPKTPTHPTPTPTTHPLHQTPQTTPKVQTPCPIHPLANSTNTPSKLPYHQPSAYVALTGDSTDRTSSSSAARARECVSQRTKARGTARRPSARARLKLRVARVERRAPVRRRERDCRVWRWRWRGSVVVLGWVLRRRKARRGGRRWVRAVRAWRVGARACVCC